MAVAEYMFVVNQHGKLEIPGFITDRGHWMNPADNTYIGWIPDTREYYVPDTIVTLTKEEFVTRQLGIHATTPFQTFSDDPDSDPVNMTDEEVTTQAEDWFDAFVTQNS